MKKRIYRNYFWVALLTILIVSFVFVFSYNQTIHAQKENGMREEAEFISSILEENPDLKIFRQASEKVKFRITLIDADGTVFYDNRIKDISKMENHGQRPEILMARESGEGSGSRISSTIKSETYYYAVKLSNGDYLRISSESVSIWDGFLRILPLLSGIAVMVTFLTFLIAHRLTNDIVDGISGIDLEDPLKQITFPELGVLQKRLDFQNRKIQKQMQRRLRIHRKNQMGIQKDRTRRR